MEKNRCDFAVYQQRGIRGQIKENISVDVEIVDNVIMQYCQLFINRLRFLIFDLGPHY